MNFLDNEAGYKATYSFWQLQLLKMGVEKFKICQSAESAWQNSYEVSLSNKTSTTTLAWLSAQHDLSCNLGAEHCSTYCDSVLVNYSLLSRLAWAL